MIHNHEVESSSLSLATSLIIENRMVADRNGSRLFFYIRPAKAFFAVPFEKIYGVLFGLLANNMRTCRNVQRKCPI